MTKSVLKTKSHATFNMKEGDLQGQMQLFKDVSQKFKKGQYPLMLTMKKKSISKVIVYRQMAWKSIVFTFCLIKLGSREQSECTIFFHSKTIFSLSIIVLQYYRDIRDQVLFFHFLLKNIKHDTQQTFVLMKMS